jgi:nucleotide-binding universal stress UspA family protein
MFGRLLVPLDGSSLAEQALGPAAAIARAAGAEVDLVLVHRPLPFAGYDDAPWNAEQVTSEDKYLETTAADLMSAASVPVTHAVLHGDSSDMICARAHDVDADLIVMTSHGRTGFSRAWIGSVADGVLRRSAIPVLVLRPTGRNPARNATRHLFKHVLVPLDGSALAVDILESAASLALCGGGRITLVRVVQPVPLMVVDGNIPFAYPPPIQDDVATARVVSDVTQELDAVAQRLGKAKSVQVEFQVVVASHVAQAILDFARGHSVDAMALSTHGRGASRLIVGSVADKILRGTGLPVMLYRPARVVETGKPEGAEAEPFSSMM